MTITRRTLLITAAAVVALFAIADPLGDSHHGLGAHHKIAADIGNVVWALFLIGALGLIVLTLVATVQHLRGRRRSTTS